MSFRSVLLFTFLILLGPTAGAASSQRYLVEFHGSPAAAKGARSAIPHADVFAQFRNDFATIETAPPAPGAPGPQIHREYGTLFFGAAVELTRAESVETILELPYVAGVYRDLEVTSFDVAGGGAKRQHIEPGAPGAGAGVTVAIIDSGVDYTHPALGGGFGPGKKVAGGYDFVNGDGDPMDDHRHGTHVAGIVAGDSAEVRGVAPGATLLAYKVLDANGRGRQSDVIAAIERAIDPNGDGDLSDRADIANLSLGSPGSPDDPVARAADTASAAGMLVCAAIGNEGFFHLASSPAAAASAIAVGAHDREGLLAEFSSRGPATRTGAIKPDLVAPGVSIRSAAIGGGTLVLSGTSMAAPYVSGVAATLIAAHPGWTPAQVKSALVNTSIPIAGEEVMSQGAGRVSAAAASASRTWAEPTRVNFGLDALELESWTDTQIVTLRNSGTSNRTFTITVSGSTPSISVAPAAPTVTVAAGQTVTVALTITVDNTTLPDPVSGSFAWGGLVTFASATETLRVPWAFLKAARAIVSYDLTFPSVAWAGVTSATSFGVIDAHTVETLVAPGTYDLLLVSDFNDEVRLITRESVRVSGNTTFDLRAADASNTIQLDARGEDDEPFPLIDTPTKLYVPRGRIIVPVAGGEASLELPAIATKTFHTSHMSSRLRLLFSETFLDGDARRAWVAQHESLSGVDGDRTLTKTEDDYATQTMSMQFPAGALRPEIGVLARDVVRRINEAGRKPAGVLLPVGEPAFTMRISMTPEVEGDFASGVQLFQYTGDATLRGLSSTVTPMIRRRGNDFVSTRHFTIPPAPVALEPDAVAPSRVLFPTFVMSHTEGYWAGRFEMYGDIDENRRSDRAAASITIKGSGGETVFSGTAGLHNPLFLPIPAPGKYTARFAGSGWSADLEIDTRGDATVPTLTSLAIHDAAGRRAQRLKLNGAGSVSFSVGDFLPAYEGDQYQGVDPARVTVYFRREGIATWTQLPVVQTAEDATNVGAVFRADLADALLREGDVALRFELADADGNSCVHVIDSAFTVAPETRRRAAR